MVQQRPGASVPTAFGVFPSSSFLKVSGGRAGRGGWWVMVTDHRSITTPLTAAVPQAQREQEQGAATFGRVSVPCAAGQGHTERVLLTPELLQRLQGHFVC